jgi:hypothetical protein
VLRNLTAAEADFQGPFAPEVAYVFEGLTHETLPRPSAPNLHVCHVVHIRFSLECNSRGCDLASLRVVCDFPRSSAAFVPTVQTNERDSDVSVMQEQQQQQAAPSAAPAVAEATPPLDHARLIASAIALIASAAVLGWAVLRSRL